MDWVKQNIKFVVGLVVSLLLIGGAGFFAYSQYNAFTAAQSALQSARGTWEDLENKDPHPGTLNVNNINRATNDLARVQQFFDRTVALFQPVPDITITNAFDLNVAINNTIARMTKAADFYGVTIKNDYSFTFRGQKTVIAFDDKASIPKYAFHLQNMERLVDAIYKARVHSLEEVKRVKVDETDSSSFGIMSDISMVQDEYLLYTPYEISFKGFSSELANVLENLTNAKDVYLVKALNVEPTDLPVRPSENRKVRRPIIRPTSSMPNNQYGANPYGGSGNPYGGGGGAYGGNPYGGGQYGMNPYAPPAQPQIQTRKKDVSDSYVISENPLLFQIHLHLVHYFEDPAVAEKVISLGEESSSGEDGYDDGYDDEENDE